MSQLPTQDDSLKDVLTLCRHCDHFVEDNIINEPVLRTDELTVVIDTGNGNQEVWARYVHLEDGEQNFDHNAAPSDHIHTGEQWRKLRPDLFRQYPDGAVGPNSRYHSRRGKIECPTNT